MATEVRGERGKVVRVAPERDGLFQFWIRKPGSSHDGWLILIPPKHIQGGIRAGQYRGEAFGGASREMTVQLNGGECTIRIHTPSDSSGKAITVDHDELNRAIAQELSS